MIFVYIYFNVYELFVTIRTKIFITLQICWNFDPPYYSLGFSVSWVFLVCDSVMFLFLLCFCCVFCCFFMVLFIVFIGYWGVYGGLVYSCFLWFCSVFFIFYHIFYVFVHYCYCFMGVCLCVFFVCMLGVWWCMVGWPYNNGCYMLNFVHFFPLYLYIYIFFI